MIATAAVALALGLAPSAGDLVQEAQEAAARGDYERAIGALMQAHELDPAPNDLFTLGQLERRSGDCREAIDFYEAYLEQPEPEYAEIAREHLAHCNEVLASEPPPPVVEQPEPKPKPEPPKPAAPEPSPAPLASPPPRARTDVTGGVLMGGAAAGTVAAAVLFGVATSTHANAGDAGSEGGYGRDLSRARALGNAGTAVAAVAGALVVGGIIRYVVVYSRSKRGRARG